MMTLDYFIPAVGQPDILQACVDHLHFNASKRPEITVIDNGSEVPIEDGLYQYKLIRNDANVGLPKSLRQAMDLSKSDIIVFAHSDLFMREQGWDEKLINAFEQDPKLGIVCVMGCRVAASNGGREDCFCAFENDGPVHGSKVPDEGIYVAMLDGCFLAMRRTAMDDSGIPDLNYPPHHFYERDWVLSMIVRGWKAKVLNLKSNHLSGKTACQPECQRYFDTIGGEQNVYNSSERMYLQKWGALLPIQVDYNGNYRSSAGPIFCSANP